MSKDNRRKLYDALSQDYDMGTYEQFCKDIQDEAKRKRLYDATSEAYDYGDYAKFSSQLGFGESKATPAPAPATPVEDVKPEQASTTQPKQQTWQPTPMQKAFMARSVQSQVDRFKASTDAMMEQTRNTMDYYRGGGGITGAPVKGKMAVNPESGRAEQAYLTPTGTATTDKAMAERETRAFNEYVDNMTVAGQLRRAGRDLQDLHRKREERAKAIHEQWAEDYKKNTAPLAAVLAADTYQPSIEGDPEYRALTAAIHQAEKRVQTLQHENDRQQGKDVGFWRGFGEVVGDIKTWDFGYSGMLDAMTMLDASKPSPKARPKTDAQKAAQQTMLEQTAEAQAAEVVYGQNDSFWNRAGVMTGEMLPFMLDFALMGGAKSGTSAVTRTIDAALLKTLRSAAPKVARNKAAQWTVKALGAMPEDLLYRAPLMTNTVQGMKTASDIIDRKLGDVVVREDGTYDFSNDKTWGSAIWQGEANSIIENYSEMFGTHLEGVLSLKTLGKIADTFGAKRLSGILAKASSSELAGIAGTMQKHLNQLGVSDYFSEVGEEYYGQLWRTMLNLDDAYKQNPDGTRTNLFLDGQFHGDIWGGMALSMGLLGAGKYSISAAAYGSMKHKVNKADTRAAETFTPEVWEGWRDRIDNTPNADIGTMAESIIADTSLTPEQRDAAMDYMEASLNLRGFNLSSIARQRGGEQTAEEAAANESYMDGYTATTPQEMNDVKRMLDLQRQRLASALSDDMVEEYDADPIGALTRTADPELRRIAADYVNAKQVYDGMIQRVRDDMDGRIAQSDAMIDSRVNRETGMIQPATMKIDDRHVYIVNGNVTMYEDGTGVDTDNSSESIIIRDANTGKIEFADPSQVLNIGEGIDAETEKEVARNQITQEIAQAAANNIDGILSFDPGETYTVIDIDGKLKPITILGYSSNGGVVADWSVDVQFPDGTIRSVDKSDLEVWINEANDRRVTQFVDEIATERATAHEVELQADETGLGNPNRDRSLLPDNWEMPYYGFNTTASRYIESERGTGGILYQDEQGNDAIVISAIDDNNYVGYFREYNEQGQPTNRWSAKFQNGSGLRENHRDMMQTAQELLPAGHELTEHTSISTDGLRNLANQLKHGYELQYDEQGNVVTNRVPLNMMARENELDLLNYENGSVDEASASFRDSTHRSEVISRLGAILAPFGLGEEAVTIEDGRIYVEHPVLRRADTPQQEAEPGVPESITNVQEYDRGYEEGTQVATTLDDNILNDAIDDLRNRDFISDEWRGRLKAYENEQQRRAAEHITDNTGVLKNTESVPNIGDSTEIPTENRESGTESVPNSLNPEGKAQETAEDDGFIPIDPALVPNFDEAMAELAARTAEAEEAPISSDPEPSAISQIPTNEKGDPIYEQVDADLAWDALMEETEDEQIAQNVIAQEIAEREDTLKKLEKQKPKAGLSTREKIKAEKDKKKTMDDIRRSIDHWKRMSTTKQRRQAEADAIRNEEARRRAEERRAQEEQARAEREEAERQEHEALNGVPDWSHDTPQDARARGYRRFGPEKVDRQEPLTSISGKDVEVKFGEGELPKGKAALIDVSSLQPSHIDGMRNPSHFLDEAQPKERTNAASRKAARKIASNIRLKEITSSVTAYTGAPTVNSRGETIQGNSRAAALRLMYEENPKQAAKYRQYLIDHAADFGLTPEQVESMEKPVLVNMLDVADNEAIRLGQFVAQDTESGGIERIKPKNAVKKMGAKIRSFANILLRSSEEEASFSQLVDANGVDVLKWMRHNKFISDTQYESAFDSRGNLTGEAANDLKGILYQSIFTGGSTRLEEMFNNLPAKAQRAILATAFRDYDSSRADRMVEEIQQSIMAYNDMMYYEAFASASNIKEATGAMESWKRQYAMDDVTGAPYLPAKKFSNFALALAAIYKGGSQRFIQQTFNDLYDTVQGTAQDTLFEEVDKTPKPLTEAIKKVLDLEYEPIKQNDNGDNGSDTMDLDTPQGETGGRGSDGHAENGEREPEGGQTADSGAGTTNDSREGDDVKPVGKGKFGDIFAAFRGKAKAAWQYLSALKSGQARGVFYRPEIGEIDLVWGEAPTPYSGKGLAHIDRKHVKTLGDFASMEEAIGVIDDVVRNGEFTEQDAKTAVFDKGDYRVVVARDESGNWVLTAFDNKTPAKEKKKRKKDAATRGTAGQPDEGARAVAPNPSSEGKDNALLSDKQALGGKSSYTAEQLESMSRDELGQLIADAEYAVMEANDERIDALLKEKQALERKWKKTPAEGRRLRQIDSEISELEKRKKEEALEASKPYREIYDKKVKANRMPLSELIAEAEADVDLSATEAQKRAGNYRKGHVQVGTFDVTIENPAGSKRSGTDAKGKKWETTMTHAYGYILGTEGVDGDHIDVFLSSDIDGWNGRKVFVVDQYKPDGSFDEHKVMLGFNDREEAFEAYLSNYEDGWEKGRRLECTEVNLEDFERWIESSKRKTKAFADYKSVKTEENATAHEGKDELHDEVRQWLGKKGLEPTEASRSAVMRYFKIGYNRAGKILNAIAEEIAATQQEETAPAKEETAATSGEGYTIVSKPYTNKQDKTLDTYLVTFDRDFSKEEQKRICSMAKEKKGWHDRETGGYMLRSREDAEEFSASVMSLSQSSAADTPVSLSDIESAIKPAETEISSSPADKPADAEAKPEKKPSKWVDEEDAEEFERLRNILRNGLGQLNMGFPPELLYAGGKMSYLMMKHGVRKFAEYAAAMIEELGDAIRPHLKALYNFTRSTDEVTSSEWAGELTPFDEVMKFDTANFDKANVDAMAAAENVVAEEASQQHLEETVGNIKDTVRQNADGTTTQTINEGGTEIEVTEGDFIPGVYPPIDDKPTKPGKKKPSNPKTTEQKPTTGQLDLFGEEEEQIINDVIEETTAPEPKPEAELSGDSADYQERSRQERDLVDDIVIEIMKRTDMKERGEDRGALTMRDIRGMLENYPLLADISATDLQELVERAMTILTRTAAKSNQADPRKGYDRVVAYYNMQPSLNARDSERLIKQQYSTPTPFGYVMGQFVNAKGDIKSVLEPSAGNGALTIMFDPATVHVNDIDERRLENLRTLGYGKVTAQNGLLPFEGEKADGVLTNPPFGSVTEKVYDGVFKISSLEGQMAINALDSMKDGGRAAIIIGGNTSYRTNGSMNPKDAAFFGYLYSHYNVVDVINISGKALYSRNGTGYDVRMILINGRKSGEFSRVYPPVKSKARAEQVTTFDELYKRVQDDIQQVFQMGHKPADEKPEGGRSSDGGESAPDRSGSNRPDKGAGQRPGTTGNGSGSASGPHIEQPAPGNKSGRPVGVDNGNGGNAGGTEDVQRPKPATSGSNGNGGAQNDRGGSGGNGRDATTSRPNGGGERLAVKPDLTTEKVPYPNQSDNGFTLLSVVPAAQAEVLQRSLGEIGDVDQFLVDELGYSSKEELYGYLAAEQIDSVALAIHQMNKGNAFIIGDMTGVGKGRQGAALIRYGVRQGRCPIYFTQKPTLFTDNYRDLADIGSSELRPFIIASNPKDANIVDAEGNVVHRLPSKKEQERVFDYIMQNGKLPKEYDYVLTTYDQIKNGTADYTQNEDGTWNTEARKLPKKSKGYTTADYNGQVRRDALARLAMGTAPGQGNIAILDESHTVGGDSGCGRYMQMLTSGAYGVTFLSATFAKRADNMPIYAQRTAISEAGVKANELIEAIAKGGVTLQEIMSKQLVESGQMIRRERSFEGVTIDWLSVEEETDRKQRAQFNEVADIFNGIRNFQNEYIKPIIDGMNEAAAEQGATVGQTQGTKDLGVRNTPFASKMYNLVNQLLFALKVDAVADRVIENLRNGFKPVISFTNTMEGFLASAPKGVAMDEVPNFSLTLMRALDGVMRYTENDADQNSEGGQIALSQLSPEGQAAYNAIKEKIMNLSADLPISPMDAIRMKIEEAGYSVAEITGRTTQLNRTEDGRYIVEGRKDRDKKAAMRDFNAGKLDVLMINKSGSTGISLHASNKFEDQRQRVMVFAQFQSDINDEVQMRGRIDRSGQVVRGRYEYIMSTIPAEQRIQMMFKAKLKSLDANTTSSQKSKFNEMEIVDYLNKYGDEVVWEYMKEHPELSERLGDPLKMLSDKKDDESARNSDKEDTSQKSDCAGKISRYLAFLSVEEQDEIFKEITEAYKVKIQLLDDAGENDLEITTMPLRAETKSKQIWHKGEIPGSGNAFADNTYVEEVEVDVLKKPMKRAEIEEMTRKLTGDKVATATEYDQTRYGMKDGEINWGRYAENMIAEVNAFFGTKTREAIEKMKEAGAKRVAKVREKAVKDAIKARAKGQNTFSDQEIETLADVVAKEAQDKEDAKQYRRREEINAVSDRIKHLLSRLRAGHIYVVPQDLKQASAEMFTQTFGTFVGFKFNKSYTLGSSTAIFATLDGRRKVELALSDKAIDTIIRCTDTAIRYSPREINAISMENWDSKVPTQTRQTRHIITGNLLQALVDTEKGEKTKGNLISFSTKDGNTRQGILMSENFKPTDLRSSVPLRSRLKQIQDGKTIVSENGDVQIEKVSFGWEHRGDYELRVPKSKQKGGIYTMNPALLKLVDGKNFVTKGNNMVGYVTPENLTKVVDMLSRAPFNLTVLEESKLTEAKETTESSDEELRFRLVEDPNLAAELDTQPSVKAYRAMQVIDGQLYSPMASGTKKSLSSPYQLNQWDVATELAFNFTDEMMAEVERLNNSTEKGYVEVIPGQLRFVKDSKGGKCSLRFHLKTDETDVWAAYNPYNHNSDSMLNDQFKAAYRRGNLVVVEAEVPIPDLESGYHAQWAKDPTGKAEWKSGDVAAQLPDEMKRTVYLSRYCKPVRVLDNKEVAKWIGDRLKKAEKLTGKKITLYEACFHPEVKRLLEKQGFSFVPVKPTKGRTSKILNGHRDYMNDAKIAELNKSLGAKDEWLSRQGDGEFTDDGISLINDPWSRAWGKTLHHKKQRKAHAERQRNSMREKVRSLTEPYGIEVEIREDASGLEGKKRTAKGWFDPRTGKIVIVLGNHSSIADVEATLLHEMVGHKGLRDLFRDKFDAFLDAVYANADNDVKERIDLLATQNGWNRRTATEEYMAGLAEDGSFKDVKSGWWQKLKGLFMDFLRSCGFSGNVKISDNELRYVLWMSWQNLKNPGAYHTLLGEAERVAKEYELKTGEYSDISDSRPQHGDEAAESDLRFRDGDFTLRDRKMAAHIYENMLKRGSYQFREAVQDSMLGLKRLYQAILGKNTRMEDIAGYENAYLYENRMSSANNGEQQQYFTAYMKPLLKSVHDLCGSDAAERRILTDYMMAKHGLERNEYMRKEAAAAGEETDRDFSGLCGLTGEDDWQAAEAEAQKMVDDYENDHDAAQVSELWDNTKRATSATLEKIYLKGLISEDTYNKVLGMYDHYIPLRGWDETTSDEVYGYLTSKEGPLMGNVFKTAEGRESKADDPIATIAMMADDAIRQGNRNVMKQRFLNFVHGNPSDLVSVNQLWLQHNDATDEWEPVFADLEPDMTAAEIESEIAKFEAKMESLRAADPDKYKSGRDARNIPYKVVRGNLDEHQVLVKRNGHTYVMTINGNPRAAQALNGLTNPNVEMGGVIGNMLKVGEWINRNLSAFYTTRNPDFVMSNFLRDMLYSNAMTWVKENPRYALRFHKNFGRLNPARLRSLLAKWESGSLSDGNYLERMFKEFMLNGGETGYTSVKDIEGHKRTIAAELKKQGSAGRKAWAALGNQLDLLNRCTENCARFAAFLTSREMGRPLDRSIYDAKEISVNFNKKGSGGKFVNATGQTTLGKVGSYLGGGGRIAYVFWNAGVQGMTNFGRAGVRNPKKALTGAAALFALGSVIPLLAQLLGGGDGDDDDKNAYYNLPEYVRRSNICFKAGEQWITIPLPIEYRAIYGMGELSTGVISGNERYGNAELARQMASQVSQILPLDMLEGGGGIAPFIPSAFKPMTEAYIMNKGWTGLSVYKDTPFNKNDPEWTKAYQSADQHLVGFAKWLNETTGGDDYKKGAIDINPAKLEYLLNGTFGGMMTFPMKIKKTGETAFGDRDFEWRNTPLLNRVVKSGDERTANRKLQNEYFKYKSEAEETDRLKKKYENAVDGGILAYAEKVDFLYNSNEYLRYEIYKEFEPDINAIRDEIKEETDPEAKKELQAELYATMRELVDCLHEVGK